MENRTSGSGNSPSASAPGKRGRSFPAACVRLAEFPLRHLADRNPEKQREDHRLEVSPFESDAKMFEGIRFEEVGDAAPLPLPGEQIHAGIELADVVADDLPSAERLVQRTPGCMTSVTMAVTATVPKKIRTPQKTRPMIRDVSPRASASAG